MYPTVEWNYGKRHTVLRNKSHYIYSYAVIELHSLFWTCQWTKVMWEWMKICLLQCDVDINELFETDFLSPNICIEVLKGNDYIKVNGTSEPKLIRYFVVWLKICQN